MSSALRTCRLIVDNPGEGAWNMAVDEALAEWSAASGIAALRFYGWTPATLSLGYFQGWQERLAHRASLQVPLVRRASGGGAILHDHELTYSLALPGGQALAGDSTWLYTAVHQALIETLSGWSIRAELCQAPTPGQRRAEPFLCFARRARGDVLAGAEKICGSAQRRRQGVLLQHGSLILAPSGAAAEIAGLGGRLAAESDIARLIDQWAQGIARQTGLRLENGPLEPVVSRRARGLVAEKYGADDWTRRR